MGVPPTPRAGLPRWTPDEDTTRVAHHPVLLRAVRHKNPTPTLRAGLSRELPVPTPVLPRLGLPDLIRPRADLPRLGLPDPTRLRADLPPHIPVGPLPQAVVPR